MCLDIGSETFPGSLGNRAHPESKNKEKLDDTNVVHLGGIQLSELEQDSGLRIESVDKLIKEKRRRNENILFALSGT